MSHKYSNEPNHTNAKRTHKPKSVEDTNRIDKINKICSNDVNGQSSKFSDELSK